MPQIYLIIVGLTLSTAGKIFLGISVMRVHGRVAKEHQIDADVIAIMRKEKQIGVWGIFMIIVGFMFEVVFYLTIGPF